MIVVDDLSRGDEPVIEPEKLEASPRDTETEEAGRGEAK
jgi:hypothetical protein